MAARVWTKKTTGNAVTYTSNDGAVYTFTTQNNQVCNVQLVAPFSILTTTDQHGAPITTAAALAANFSSVITGSGEQVI